LNSNQCIVDTQSKLKESVSELEKEKVIALDLESDSMYHFMEKVCLIQVASSRHTYLFDPLLPYELVPLKKVLENCAIKKILHGADYDIRSLHRDFAFEINNLFDTQLACRYLGIKETGLDAVLSNFFDVSLNKKYQKKDWSQRPLPDEMIDYAANDVAYLLPLAKILEDELKKLGRLSWVMEDCVLLSQVRQAPANQQPLFTSYKGAGAMPPKELAVLEAVLQVRKKIAVRKDRPLFKIFQNKVIDEIVHIKPVSRKKLEKMRVLSAAQLGNYSDMILEAVQYALSTPKNELPVYPKVRSRSLKIIEQKRVKRLKEWKDLKGEELNIDPSLVLNKAQIIVIAVRHPRSTDELEQISEIKRWQIDEFGADIVDLLKKE
jgi:ribonuclease D